MALSQEDGTILRTAYDQLCVSYRAIDDFRAKLLGFLPLATGGGLLLLTGRADGFAREFFLPVGLFGLVVTLGLFSYEIYGIKKCHALINAGKAMESSLALAAGQFQGRPRAVLRHVNEPFAAAIIYPAVMAAWTYLAAFEAPPWARGALAVAVFIVGFAITFEYNRRLGEDVAGGHEDPAAASRPQGGLAQF